MVDAIVKAHPRLDWIYAMEIVPMHMERGVSTLAQCVAALSVQLPQSLGGRRDACSHTVLRRCVAHGFGPSWFVYAVSWRHEKLYMFAAKAIARKKHEVKSARCLR